MLYKLGNKLCVPTLANRDHQCCIGPHSMGQSKEDWAAPLAKMTRTRWSGWYTKVEREGSSGYTPHILVSRMIEDC